MCYIKLAEKQAYDMHYINIEYLDHFKIAGNVLHQNVNTRKLSNKFKQEYTVKQFDWQN